MSESGSDKFEKRYGDRLSDLNADINVTFKKRRREFYDFYAQSLPLLERMQTTYHNLLALLTSNLDTGAPKIMSRIKDRNGCIEKFERNYRTKAEKEYRDKYRIDEYITDLIGLRVICLYEDDVRRVRKIIEENFDVIEVTDKTKQIEENSEKFGYKGLHLDIKLNDKRDSLPEFLGFGERTVEVQVRSIVQDAWSEVDHKLKYKKRIPVNLKRMINQIAATFEMVDRQFTQIRKDTELLESLKAYDELAPEREIDSFSFIASMKTHFSGYNFDNEPNSENATKIDSFVDEIVYYKSDISDEEFQRIMSDSISLVERYRQWKYNNGGFTLNPFTTTRHILYLSNKRRFRDILFAGQRKAFDAWLQADSNADI